MEAAKNYRKAENIPIEEESLFCIENINQGHTESKLDGVSWVFVLNLTEEVY